MAEELEDIVYAYSSNLGKHLFEGDTFWTVGKDKPVENVLAETNRHLVETGFVFEHERQCQDYMDMLDDLSSMSEDDLPF